MSDIAIRVEHLSKQYRLGQREPYKSLRDVLARAVVTPMRWLGGKTKDGSAPGTFWALDDVSLEIKHGEAVGIIGRNGAGKSTLLKILSRITKPTRGHAEIYGRVGSLLEVGTGFHPELTGRENIYLNGAILGMHRAEIARKFDEIVDFSGVEKFLDTPVKHFSSGMYVRLAFAVAAHLEPEILLVDEVLAVGDAEFQRKCLGKMQNVATEGRTVLFVSHNMAAVENLCPRSLLISGGRLILCDDTPKVIEHYLGASELGAASEVDLNQYRPRWASPIITAIRTLGSDSEPRASFPLGSDISFELQFETSKESPIRQPIMGVTINHLSRGTVGGVNMRMVECEVENRPHYSGTISCTISKPHLLQGEYSANIWLGDGPVDVDAILDCLRFTVSEADVYQSGRMPHRHLGVIYLEPRWTVRLG